MRRRLTALALSLALTLGLTLPAAAQIAAPATYSIPGAGGVVQWSTASASCANTTGECNFWGATLPPSYFSTSSLTNQTPPVATSLPLHLTMLGTMTSNTGAQQVSTLTIGVNYGGAEATMPLVNNVSLPQALIGVPVKLDVWMSPIATNTAPGNTVLLTGRFSWGAPYVTAPAGFATESVFNAVVVGRTRTASAATLNVNLRFGSASTSNAINFYNRTLVIGQ